MKKKKSTKRKSKYRRNNDALKLIGKRIKEIRILQEISQRQLAAEIDLARNQLIRIESGKVNTGISTLADIALALEVPLKELFEF